MMFSLTALEPDRAYTIYFYVAWKVSYSGS